MASGSSSILPMYPQNGQAMGASDRRALEAIEMDKVGSVDETLE
jgi:hypothetical protein